VTHRFGSYRIREPACANMPYRTNNILKSGLSMNRRKLLLIIFVMIIPSLFCSLGLLSFLFPRTVVYRYAVSPEGTWSVTVFKERVSLFREPLGEGVNVIVRVQDREGRILFHERIDQRDLWLDVDQRYPEVIIDEEKILIGPDYWGPNQFFALEKKDLDLGRSIATKMK
jgi:hypothetical protein